VTVCLGAHVPGGDPLAEAAARDAGIVQFFLGDPQSWKKPPPREDAEVLAAAAVDLYVHAPYLVNVVNPNNRIRIPSRKILADTIERSEEIGAKGIIVHAGHVSDEEDVAEGFPRWRKALEQIETDIPILIENTAGGTNAMGRRMDVLGRLWEVIGDLGPGICLDTCHAWAGGEELEGLVERVVAITGRIDVVHLNDSRDGFDSRRDRHANLGAGQIPEELLVEVVRQADTDTIIETPGGTAEHVADLKWIRDRL
jgi:deoxyribonuclease-4